MFKVTKSHCMFESVLSRNMARRAADGDVSIEVEVGKLLAQLLLWTGTPPSPTIPHVVSNSTAQFVN